LSFTVDFEPIGRRVLAEGGDTVLEVAQRGGIVLNATCGGEGACGRCIVRLMEGQASEPNITEEAELGNNTTEGWRLACQAIVLGDLKIHIPPDSLATAQRIQTEGQSLPIELGPGVKAVELTLPPASLKDLRSDALRLRQGLGIANPIIPLAVMRSLSDDLRDNDYRVSAFLREDTVVGVRPAGTTALGLAVDLGTTKLAAYLVDLASGETLATAGVMNPQIAFGEDVMARIGHAINKPEGREQLRSVIVTAMMDLAMELCGQAGRTPLDIADAVVVGNTAMHHLFLGLQVKQLGLAPYVAAESDALDVGAREIGLEFAPGANVHLLPNIAGFVGADHVAMLLGSGMVEREGIVLGMDIGTNTEISLMAHGKHYACSTASGPAFEGAHITHGMRAAPGAIEKVVIREGQVRYQTIDGQPPVGLCGSGILDVVAQMYREGIIDARGSFTNGGDNPRVQRAEKGLEYVVASEAEAGGREISFNRRDVNEVQLAKGAMMAGILILLEKAGLQVEDIDTVIIAGAFGTYLDVGSGMDIGMFPRIEREKFTQVGNAAGDGARMALLSMAKREQAVQVANRVTYVELTVEPSFSTVFANSLFLD